jgi:hypothetical protein
MTMDGISVLGHAEPMTERFLNDPNSWPSLSVAACTVDALS